MNEFIMRDAVHKGLNDFNRLFICLSFTGLLGFLDAKYEGKSQEKVPSVQ